MNSSLYDLYIKYLFRKLPVKEILRMRQEVNASSQEELETMMATVWEEHQELPSMPDSLKRKTKQSIDLRIRRSRQRNRVIRFASVAASLALLIAGSYFLLINRKGASDIRQLCVQVEGGNKTSVKLPDNTSVQLNSETRLVYDIDDPHTRKVTLEGEAFFQVSKDKKRPFIVDLGDLVIEVVGTSFNVQRYKTDDLIKASLIEGSIRLSGKKLKQSYSLQPMQQVIYRKSDGDLRIVSMPNQKDLEWMNDRLVFDSEPLKKVLEKIERWYGVTIDMQYSAIDNDLISGTFHKESLESVLEMLRLQYKINYKIKEKHIVITKAD